MDFNIKMLEQLYEYALEDTGVKRYYLAAALVQKKGILSLGWNSYSKSHPLQKKFAENEDAIFLHAEIDAFRRYKRYNKEIPDNITVYVCHAGKDDWRLARPCKSCMGALQYYGVERVIFSRDGRGNYTCLTL